MTSAFSFMLYVTASPAPAIFTTHGSSRFTALTPCPGRSVKRGPFAFATPSSEPSVFKCPLPMFVMTATSGGRIAPSLSYSELNDSGLVPLIEPEERKGQPDEVVLVALGLEHAARAREYRGYHLLCRGLAGAAGDRHDRYLVEPSIISRQGTERLKGVLYYHDNR